METKPAFSAAVSEVLKPGNYLDWSVRVKTYLMAQDLWDIVESRSGSPPPEYESVYKDWSKMNAMALHVIQIACGPDTFFYIRDITSARIAWETLAGKYKPKGPDPLLKKKKGLDPSSSMASVLLEEGKPGESDEEGTIYEIYMDLYKSLQIGDWNAAKEFLDRHPHAINAKITVTEKTALHIAAEVGHVHIVEELAERMSEEDLKTKDSGGFTALARAAYNGNYRMAEYMLQKNRDLVSIATDIGVIPVVLALVNGHLKLARYLYSLTPLKILMPENGTMGATVVCEAIFNKALDIALDLVKSLPRLAVVQDRYGNSPFYALACMPDCFLCGNQLVFWKRWIYSGINIQLDVLFNDIRVNIENRSRSDGSEIIGSGLSWLRRLVPNLQTLFGIKHLYEMKLTHFLSSELLRHMKSWVSMSNIQEREIRRVGDAIVRATKEGIFEFVFEMVKSNPQFVWSHDKNSSSIFSVAVQYRRAKIFSLIYDLNMINSLASGTDSIDGNNLLHMAGMFKDSTLHKDILGPALQMQRELQWFKEVESIAPTNVRVSLNEKGLTPRQLFTKDHEDMMRKGEKWMKDTVSSCTLMGALIVTIMFAAAFTVPGGNDQNTGFPIFINKKLFMVFIVSVAFSLFSSTTSVLTFLGIFTSPYAEEEIPQVLANKNDNRPFFPFALYSNHDSSLFCCTFTYAKSTIMDFPSYHFLGLYSCHPFCIDAVPPSFVHGHFNLQTWHL